MWIHPGTTHWNEYQYGFSLNVNSGFMLLFAAAIFFLLRFRARKYWKYRSRTYWRIVLCTHVMRLQFRLLYCNNEAFSNEPPITVAVTEKIADVNEPQGRYGIQSLAVLPCSSAHTFKFHLHWVTVSVSASMKEPLHTIPYNPFYRPRSWPLSAWTHP